MDTRIMARIALALPRGRGRRMALLVAAAVVLYLVALSAIPALLGTRDDAGARRQRALRAITAANWGLVPLGDREALAGAVDDAWRELRAYHMRYVTGLPDDLAAGRPETEAESFFRLDERGMVTAQRDRSSISAASPASGGQADQFEGFRIRTDKPYVNRKGQRVGTSELVYQRAIPGVWTCERVVSDRGAPVGPGLDFAAAGDGGLSEIDGRPVRAFVLPAGGFGLRSPATVWVETDTLRLRRQEIESVLAGRREIWTYGEFDQQVEITPPTGIPCDES